MTLFPLVLTSSVDDYMLQMVSDSCISGVLQRVLQVQQTLTVINKPEGKIMIEDRDNFHQAQHQPALHAQFNSNGSLIVLCPRGLVLIVSYDQSRDIGLVPD